MCGIAGYVLRELDSGQQGVLEGLIGPLRERGPDDEGLCLIARGRPPFTTFRTDHTADQGALPHIGGLQGQMPHDVALINTRFAIFDLSPAGHQPFSSHDGAVVGVFNGEIYNHVELRAELLSIGVVCRSTCDTEVLVEGYRVWRDDLWPKLNGFWAAAIYDTRDRTLALCRDRLGVAPLYVRETERGLYFASSIASLRSVPPLASVADSERVVGFIETSLKDFDRSTLFQGIATLPPATAARIGPSAWRLDASMERRFWTPPADRLSSSDISIDDAARMLRDVFFSAVELRLRSDVPVAFELSGGLDSSSIVAAAATIRPGILTYTIEVPEHNEEPFARAMRDRYELDYRVLRNPEQDFMARAPWFAERMAEPFHSPNIYTHFMLRQHMKAEKVDVVLSGAGGDEVLAGYEWQFWPQARRAIEADGQARAALRYEWAMYVRQLSSWPETRARIGRVLQRLREESARLAGAAHTARAAVAQDGNAASRLHTAYPSLSYDQQRRYHFETGLLPYYLRSNDQFTMMIPIEHRFPFLDYRVVELGFRMPPAYLFHNGWTKFVMRKAMEPLLPARIVWRKEKMGFPFPYARFLRAHRGTLAAMLERVREAGVDVLQGRSYEEAVDVDPLRLWRTCSTGLWLDAAGVDMRGRSAVV